MSRELTGFDPTHTRVVCRVEKGKKLSKINVVPDVPDQKGEKSRVDRMPTRGRLESAHSRGAQKNEHFTNGKGAPLAS
jgi:hypothetical protein